MVRVLVADDHAMLREMLRIAVSRMGDMTVVGEAQDGREVVQAVVRCRPDVVLLDYKMPLVHDFAALVGRISETSPATHVIVLSGFATAEIATCAAGAGARGYVLKSTRLHAVVDAIRAVAGGGVWIDPNLPKRVFALFQEHATDHAEEPTGLAGLTRREREVLACVAQGLGNRDISQKLAISQPTVKTHLTRIFAKLAVKNRTHAALVYFGRESDASA
jgi:DNA-binding NarL/FixJ family response regulator